MQRRNSHGNKFSMFAVIFGPLWKRLHSYIVRFIIKIAFILGPHCDHHCSHIWIKIAMISGPALYHNLWFVLKRINNRVLGKIKSWIILWFLLRYYRLSVIVVMMSQNSDFAKIEKKVNWVEDRASRLEKWRWTDEKINSTTW